MKEGFKSPFLRGNDSLFAIFHWLYCSVSDSLKSRHCFKNGARSKVCKYLIKIIEPMTRCYGFSSPDALHPCHGRAHPDIQLAKFL